MKGERMQAFTAVPGYDGQPKNIEHQRHIPSAPARRLSGTVRSISNRTCAVAISFRDSLITYRSPHFFSM